jgi:hypothetical protein
VLRSNDQHAIGLGELAFEAHGLFRQVAFKILIEHRQIVDASETGVELIGAELGKRTRQFAVDGIAAVAPHNDCDTRFCHATLLQPKAITDAT